MTSELQRKAKGAVQRKRKAKNVKSEATDEVFVQNEELPKKKLKTMKMADQLKNKKRKRAESDAAKRAKKVKVEESDEEGTKDEVLEDEERVDEEHEDEEVGEDEEQVAKGEVKNKRKTDAASKRKQLAEVKRKKNKAYEMCVEAKKMWEEVRREDCPASKRERLLSSLLNKIKGRVKEIIRAHDMVRVVECIVALGTNEHRTMLFEELKEMIVELSKLKYAKFFVQKMLKYGSKEQKDLIIRSFYGHVKRLVNHTEAAAVVEYAYNEVANHKQRIMLTQEYYGPQFALFKDENTNTLEQVLKKANESEKKKILLELKEELIKLTNKNSFKHSIAHVLFREFFRNASVEDKKELIACINQQVVEMLHTKDGSRVAMQCLWYGTAKDRKAILKSFKKFVPNIAKEENGHLVLIAAFDCVDDVKLLEKAIISELVASANALEIAKDRYGVKVLEYLVSPRDPRFFHKDVVAILVEGDDNPHSKKDRETRVKELKQIAEPHLMKLVKEHAKELLLSGSTSLLLSNILTTCEKVNKVDAMKEVVKVYNEEGLYHGGDSQHIVERACAALSLRKIINNDKTRQSQGENDANPCFSQLFVEMIPNTVLRSYIGCNRGCFLLLALIETELEPVAKKVITSLEGVNNKLREKDYKGASLLLNILKKQ